MCCGSACAPVHHMCPRFVGRACARPRTHGPQPSHRGSTPGGPGRTVYVLKRSRGRMRVPTC
eukprot:2758400-Alexandrium_andersonii.AAC.1